MINIITGTTNKPVACEKLKNFFLSNESNNGFLYIGYPIIGTSIGAFPIDAVWVSEEKGLVVFNLIEGKDTKEYESVQDDCANKIESKLKSYKQLMNKRRLCVSINIVTFAPSIIMPSEPLLEYPLCNVENLQNVLDQFQWDEKEYHQDLLSILQSISTIKKSKKRREILDEKSRGYKLKLLEDSIANLDNRQSKAVIETVEGVQRIRGLAGSGKTIVLALKAAYLHAQHPEWNIAITFNTRSLKGQFKSLINTFYIEQTNEEPDWDKLQIIHAWGAPGGLTQNGLYFNYCVTHQVDYLDYNTARFRFGKYDTFGNVCEKAITDTKIFNPLFDVILVDEAQDFSPSFLRMCYEFLKEPKRLVYAYDELQNLGTQSLPSPEKIFGNKMNGSPRVSFGSIDKGKPQQDIILEKCYRNSRPVIVTAHALGFGIYRENVPSIGTGIVQMFEQASLWNDIGYSVVEGDLEGGKKVVLERNSNSSPEFLETHSDINDLIQFLSFRSEEEQNSWVTNQIVENLAKDELRPDDIIVINPNPLTTRNAVAPIRSELFDRNINSHTAGIDTSPDVFFASESESVTFTGIYRAKGNEAAMVYIINSQECFESTFEMAKIRNQLFTAITRSKAWVRVLGVGENMDLLIREYERVKESNYSLNFIYPTEEQQKNINMVNRDMSEGEKNKVKKKKSDLAEIISEIESGQLYFEDLGIENVNKLKALFDKKASK